MNRLRIYTDTSVIGGCFDKGFDEYSLRFLNAVMRGEIEMIWSEVCERELLRAPRHVRDVMLQIPPENVIRIETSDEARRLADLYLAEGIVGAAQRNDALHVAIAVVVEADCLASWNHRHLTNLDKMRRFNAVNLSEGYRTIDIRSPVELYSHD